MLSTCCSITDLRDKDVICLRDGTNLGNVCDVTVDTVTGKLCQIIVYGRLRFFGLLGREEDFIVPWDNIEVIGEDAVLVDCDPPPPKRKTREHTHSHGFSESLREYGKRN